MVGRTEPDTGVTRLPAASDDASDIVVVAHGLWMPTWVTAVLRGRLEAAGFATVAYGYSSVTAGLDENAARLGEFAARLLDTSARKGASGAPGASVASAASGTHGAFGTVGASGASDTPGVSSTPGASGACGARSSASASGRRVHFVGHSLGGVVAARMLGWDGYGRERLRGVVGRLVCLGSPLVACHGADVLLAHRWTRLLAGRTLADLVAEGGLGRWPGPTEIGILAGDISLGFGQLLGGLPRPHDGTVSVAETRLPGATAHRVLHATHTSLLWLPEVADETVRFLRTGRFSSAS
jgi:hypothetical protein